MCPRALVKKKTLRYYIHGFLKRIGLEVDTVRPNEATFDEFQTVFANPLSESTREAMDVLFPGRKQRPARIACAAEV